MRSIQSIHDVSGLGSEELVNVLQKILKYLEHDLIIGSGNQVFDLQKTAEWSGSAVEHARMMVVYNKSKSSDQNITYLPFFLQMKKAVHGENKLMSYALNGSNGLLARAGNCQEYVGLAIYYLIKNIKDSSLCISVMELDDCFDHVFLKIVTSKKSIYFDPHMRATYPAVSQLRQQNMLEIALQIINNLHYELKNAVDSEEQNEIKNMIQTCENKVKSPIKAHVFGTLRRNEFEIYCKYFDDHYAAGLKEIYPQQTNTLLKCRIS